MEQDPAPALARFMEPVESLGSKLGPILFQLPPRWSRNVERLTVFLEALPPSHRYTFEFRDPSWHDAVVYRTLRQHNAAFCMYELDGLESPHELTADFTYVRFMVRAVSIKETIPRNSCAIGQRASRTGVSTSTRSTCISTMIRPVTRPRTRPNYKTL